MSRHRNASLAVGLVALAVYLGSTRTFVSVDHTTNVLVAYSMALHGDPWLERWLGSADAFPFWHQPWQGHEISWTWYAPGAEMIAAPVAWLGALAGIVPPQAASATIVGKLAAALCAAGSVAFVHRTAALVTGRRWALAVAAIYAFGTPTWPTSAGGLWQHGPAQLAVAAGVFLLVASRRAPALAARAGLAFAAAVVIRPQNVVQLIPAGIVVGIMPSRGAVRYALWAVAPFAALAVYWAATFGREIPPLWYTPERNEPLLGLLGNLVSPSRGLFVNFPVLILGAIGLVRRAGGGGPLGAVARGLLVGAVGVLVVHSVYGFWSGGVQYLNRYLADVLPVLALGLALWVREHGRDARSLALLVALAAVSIGVAAIGALLYEWRDALWEQIGTSPVEQQAWRLDRIQAWYALTTSPRLDATTALGAAVLAFAIGMLAWLGRASRTVRGATR